MVGRARSPSLTVLASSLALVLAAIAALHVFWALGGRVAFGSVLPEIDGRPAFTPTRAVTFAVALGLFAASVLVLGRADLLGPRAPAALFKWPVLALAAVFLARGVGDFRLVGVFKRVRGTSFAAWDSWLFSPLCLAISLGAFWLGLL
jgi:hypothetical protein